jgi:hypothetical protein
MGVNVLVVYENIKVGKVVVNAKYLSGGNVG